MINLKQAQDQRILFLIPFLIIFITLLILLQIQTLRNSFPFSLSCDLELNETRSRLQDMVTFLPLKDLRYTHDPLEGHTWFMSSINDMQEENELQYLYFPSKESKGRVLCMHGHDSSNGANNSYALTWPDVLPSGVKLLSGLTFISETFYDYTNLWHGLSAMTPFVAWHERKACVLPERWILFHWGELRVKMAPWLQTLMEVTLGRKVDILKFDGEGPMCFEKALVFRHNDGGMAKTRKEIAYDMMRCKARAYCNVSDENDHLKSNNNKVIRLTLFLRVGSRSFKNETAVVAVSGEQCRSMDGCRLRVARSYNLSFCDQVRLMRDTDILITPHGAQLTNMIFMNKNSSILEFFPKGWSELAGVGQYVFRWLADWAGMRHEGAWYDPDGQQCPYTDEGQCFTFHKDGQIGIDETFIANWLTRVLNQVKEYKSNGQTQLGSNVCPCS